MRGKEHYNNIFNYELEQFSKMNATASSAYGPAAMDVDNLWKKGSYKGRHKEGYKGHRGKGKGNYKAKEHHNGPSRKDGATQENETTAITTVWTTKAKDTKAHTTKEAKAKAKEKVKETTTTAKEKEHATNAAGTATTLENAALQFGNYRKESLKKTTTTRWKRSTQKTTQLQVMQSNLVHQATTTQPATSVESTKGWSSDTTKTRTRPPTTEMRATMHMEAITTTGTTST